MSDLVTTRKDPPCGDASLNESIQRQILELIRDERLTPDSRLPSELDLSRRFQVSRSALREAMRTLEGAGYLESRMGSGWYVKPFTFDALTKAITYTLPLDLDTLRDLAEVRALLETNLIETAMTTLTPEDLVALEDAVDEMEVLASASGFSFAGPDEYFHRKLFSRLKNQVVLNLLDIFWRFQMGCSAFAAEVGDPVEEARKHRRLLNAVRAGNVELARRRMQESLEEKRLRLLAARYETEESSQLGA
jgi:GntR family transcriptional regulator, transcriptional repressor for pyruvate dehydrogenase complex